MAANSPPLNTKSPMLTSRGFEAIDDTFVKAFIMAGDEQQPIFIGNSRRQGLDRTFGPAGLIKSARRAFGPVFRPPRRCQTPSGTSSPFRGRRRRGCHPRTCGRRPRYSRIVGQMIFDQSLGRRPFGDAGAQYRGKHFGKQRQDVDPQWHGQRLMVRAGQLNCRGIRLSRLGGP
jgi:hypothetical protein